MFFWVEKQTAVGFFLAFWKLHFKKMVFLAWEVVVESWAPWLYSQYVLPFNAFYLLRRITNPQSVYLIGSTDVIYFIYEREQAFWFPIWALIKLRTSETRKSSLDKKITMMWLSHMSLFLIALLWTNKLKLTAYSSALKAVAKRSESILLSILLFYTSVRWFWFNSQCVS